MSSDLAEKVRLGLAELATIREQFAPLLCLPDATVGIMERAAASAMLHSFYTEIEKILKLIGGRLCRIRSYSLRCLTLRASSKTRPGASALNQNFSASKPMVLR